MEDIIKTNIDGLSIKLNKIIIDERGFLAELAPSGTDNPLFKDGIKNIYTSTAIGKHIARAGHLHLKNIENFYTLSGTALWLFLDFRKDSSSFNKICTMVLGSKAPNIKIKDPIYTIDQSKMAQIHTPAGVYHIFWPLTDEPVTILAIASEPYNKEDYEYPDLKSIPGIKGKLSEYGIVI